MYNGDFAAGATVSVLFDTDASGVPSTLGGSPSARVYKDGDAAQSVAGVTLTPNFDGITGLNFVQVDTSADPTFYAAGNTFHIVLDAGTVDGASIPGRVLGSFSIEGRSGPLASAYTAARAAKLDNLDITVGSRAAAGVSVTISSPVATGGTLTIKRGDDYSVLDSHSIDFSLSGSYDPSAPTSITLKVYSGASALGSFAGTVIGTSAPWTLRFQPTAAETTALPAAVNYRYDIEVVKNARKVTVVEGTCTVLEN